MTSIFIFNLRHPLFGMENREGVDVQLVLLGTPTKQSQRYVIDSLVEALFVTATDQAQAMTAARRKIVSEVAGRHRDMVVSRAKNMLPRPFDLGPLAIRLAKAYAPQSARWLQTRLQGYALQLLSQGWETLSESRGGPDEPVDSVIDTIASDFPGWSEPPADLIELPDAVGEDTPDVEDRCAGTDTDADVRHAPHVTLLYALVHHLAVQLLRYIIRRQDGDPGELSFSLTPTESAGVFLWEMRGYHRSDHIERPPSITYIGLAPIEVDMTKWLSERRETSDTYSGPLPRKRLGRRIRPALQPRG